MSVLTGFTNFSTVSDFLPQEELDVSSLQDDATVIVAKEEVDNYETGEPNAAQALSMIEAFMVKKREWLKNNPQIAEEKKVEAKKIKVISDWRGRPRKHFMKTVTMVEVEASGWLRLAGRGRPKAGTTRVKIEVAHDFYVDKDIFYVMKDKNLVEAKGAK